MVKGQSQKTKLLLILGPAGVGKSTVIKELQRIDPRFIYIMPFTTRALRSGESDKIHIDVAQLANLVDKNEILCVNNVYGHCYGTPREPLLTAFANQDFPVIDWPVDRVDELRLLFPNIVLTVYLEPPSLNELDNRLRLRGGDDAARISAAKSELARLHSGALDALIDLRLVSQNGEAESTSNKIYHFYLHKISKMDGTE
jgi:guanylate kinase